MTTNRAASIRSRLLNRARAEQTDLQLLLDRYACERFLYRLGMSSARDRCILKGASLLAVWMEEPYRATRDVDLLAFGPNDGEAVREVMGTICDVSCPEDALSLDFNSLRIEEIRDGQRYGGQRAKMIALLGNTRCNIQVDFGFGDVVVPAPEDARLPTLIEGVPAPHLRAYPRVSSVAEKFESMVQLGTANSRMKDFYDIWALSQAFDFDGSELRDAVARCFERRGTPWDAALPEVLTPAYYSTSAQQDYWAAYGNQAGLLRPPPGAFAEVGDGIRAFLGPVRDSILAERQFDMRWTPAGPWEVRPS